MYFTGRTYIGGGASYDPRSIKWSVWQCDVCKEETHLECRLGVDMKFDKARECPECHSFDSDDYIKRLMIKKESLLTQQEQIAKEIELIIQQLNKGVEQIVVE
jgi:hypothetical protein